MDNIQGKKALHTDSSVAKNHSLTEEQLASVMKLRKDLGVSFLPFGRDFLLDIIPEEKIVEIERNDKVNRYGLGCEVANIGNYYSNDTIMVSRTKLIKGFHPVKKEWMDIVSKYQCGDILYSLSNESEYPVKENDFYRAGGKKLAQQMMYFCATRFSRSYDYDRLFFLATELAKSSVEKEFNWELHQFLVALDTTNEEEQKEHLQNARAIMVVRDTAIDNWNRYYSKTLFKNVIRQNLLEYLVPINESYYYRYGVLSKDEHEVYNEYNEIYYALFIFTNELVKDAYAYFVAKDKEALQSVLSLEIPEAQDFIQEIKPRIFNLNWKISSVAI